MAKFLKARLRDTILSVIIVTLMPTILRAQGATRSPAEPPFSLAITAAESPVKAGSPVVVKVVMRNRSDHDISVYRDNSSDQGGFTYNVSALDETGASAPETKFGKTVMNHETAQEQAQEPSVLFSSGGEINLAVGEAIKDRVDVTKLYDLHRPGRYSIQIQRFDLETKSYVKSNKITVTVAE
jgi:hypothetical protein